ncbi:DNA excision repair protein ERCC-5 homolog isoform X2 [Neocloeon triangulifer]|uniref:DNA excision repair protein ERCC-5 homolog isoform X2 n=1 Tax=Neocloeon triangulifer TaxID=2078957 RepID=UPI00286F7225|nr:DNA excision repair protein ERCC-5 homolog isoform X2 [Neocloeon triangulifer]
MGVHGLWKLLEPTGQPVNLETLENKVLAIDVSMWLHQAMKGYHDASGNALPNAHLLGLFHRICKLMFYNIKPVFVFDGGVPQLKKQTLAKRKQMKKRAGKKAEQERLRLLRNLMEQDMIQRAKGNSSGANLKLPASMKKNAYSDFVLPEEEPEAIKLFHAEETDSSDDDIEEIITWENFNPNSKEFKQLPANSRLEILSHLKDTRKQNSWGRIHEMPQESDVFSGFQMKRLLLRRSAQVELEFAEKELSKRHTLSMEEIKEIMAEKGSLASKLAEMDTDYGQRISSDAVTRFILINNPDQREAKLAVEGNDELEVATTSTIIVKQELGGEETTNDDPFPEDVIPRPVKKEIDETEFTQEEIMAIISSTKEAPKEEVVVVLDDDPSQPSTSAASSSILKQRKKLLEILLDSEDQIISDDSIFIEEKTENVKISMHQNLSDETKERAPKLLEDATSCLLKQRKIQENQTSPSDGKKLLEILLDSEAQNNSDDDIFIEEKTENVLVSMRQNFSDETKKVAPIMVGDSRYELLEVIEKQKIVNIEKEQEKSIDIHVNVEKILPKEEDIFAEVFPVKKSTEDFGVASSPASAVSVVGVMSSCEESIDEDEEDELPEEVHKEAKFDGMETVDPGEILEHKEEEPQSQISNFRNMNFTEEELKQLEEKLAKESTEIVKEIGRQERIATNISDQMCQEAQELIALFGMPFVVAPMEAEAQCAMLDLLSLTHGTVTDDSDIWLFGGRTVYRNFFNQAKNVERYTNESISKSFRLTRDRLILLAMLVGSDYTVGISGVGPVTALEIISEFASNVQGEIADPEELVMPLKNFREWCVSRNIKNLRQKKLKTTLKDISFQDGFPSEAVVNAYVHPQVSESKDKFSWSKPDIEGLLKFTLHKFGWSKGHSESILDPVIKRMGESKIQGRIDAYFPTLTPTNNKSIDLVVSSRVRNAINQLNGFASESNVDLEPQPSTSTAAKNSSAVKSDKSAPKKSKLAITPSKLNEFKKQLVKKPKATPLESLNKKVNVPKKESIPQREKDKQISLQSKLKAIEVFRKRKIDPAIKPRRPKRLVAKDNYLSESSDSD